MLASSCSDYVPPHRSSGEARDGSAVNGGRRARQRDHGARPYSAAKTFATHHRLELRGGGDTTVGGEDILMDTPMPLPSTGAGTFRQRICDNWLNGADKTRGGT